MKTLSFLNCLILFLFYFLPPPSLPAQATCDSWPPEQYHQIAEELMARCSTHINLPFSQLLAFLREEDAHLYHPTIAAPCPFPSGIPTPGTFSFVWDPIPGAEHYTIRFLNLSTGDSGEFHPTNPEFTLTHSPTDHYLFLFSTTSTNRSQQLQKSGNYIIIDEKLIIITYPPDDYNLFKKALTDNTAKDALPTLSELRISPNPSSHLTYLEYELTSPQEVSIQIIDAWGRLRQSLQNAIPQAAGRYRLQISAEEWSAGNYYCRIQTDREIKYLPWIKY